MASKMGIIERIYYSSPVFIKEVLLDLKGFELKKTRYGGKYVYHYHEIKRRMEWSKDELNKLQDNLLIAAVRYAESNCDFYSRLYKPYFSDFKSICDFSALPVITKDDLRQYSRDILSKEFRNKKLLYLKTTGTTGAPITIPCDLESRRLHYAFYNSFLALCGVHYNDKRIVIGGRTLLPANSAPPFWLNSKLHNTLFMSSYHMSNDTLESYINRINSFNPTFIEAYPSALRQLALFSLYYDVKITANTRAIVTSSEVLSDETRSLIERAFGCKVYDQYGSVEMCGLVHQCRKGSYHVRTDYGLLEILDDNDECLEVGQVGNLVFTGFVNKAFPLVRYKIGDRGSFGGGCDCGLNTPVLESIEGRDDDYLVTKKGFKVGRMSPALKGMPIIESQFYQKVKGEVTVFVVPAPSYDSAINEEIKIRLARIFGRDMDVKVKVVKSIKRGAGNKLRAVISEVMHDQK